MRIYSSPSRRLTARRYGVFVVGTFMLLGHWKAAAQCHYTYVQLPNPPGRICTGFAINNLGWVTGQLANSGDNYRAFIYTPETGTTVLPLPPGYSSQVGYDINDLGHVVGSLLGPAGSVAFLWNGTDYTFIPHPKWANFIEARGINNQDQVVGMAYNNLTGPLHGFFWEAGDLTDLGAIGEGENSEANSINEHGCIVGCADRETPRHAFCLDDLGVEWLVEADDAISSRALNENNNGFVVGSMVLPADPPGSRVHSSGAVWAPSELNILLAPPDTTPNIFVTGVNRGGRAVGYYFLGPYRAILWQNGVTSELSPLVRPAPPPGLYSASDINDSGKIVAPVNNGSIVLTPIWVTGDLTGDCHVAIEDLVIVLSNFGAPRETFPRGDVDLDGDVDISDLSVLLSNWGL